MLLLTEIKFAKHPKGYLITNVAKDTTDRQALMHTAYAHAGRKLGIDVHLFDDAYDKNGNCVSDSAALVIVGDRPSCLHEFYKIAMKHPAMKAADKLLERKCLQAIE